jgi:hypothetical protein
MEKNLADYHKANMVALDVIDSQALKVGLQKTFIYVEESYSRSLDELEGEIHKIRSIQRQQEQINVMIDEEEQ